MEYLFIILFIYASYLSIEKYVHTGSIFTWRGRKDKKERRTAPAAIHPAIAPSQAGKSRKSRFESRIGRSKCTVTDFSLYSSGIILCCFNRTCPILGNFKYPLDSVMFPLMQTVE